MVVSTDWYSALMSNERRTYDTHRTENVKYLYKKDFILLKAV